MEYLAGIITALAPIIVAVISLIKDNKKNKDEITSSIAEINKKLDDHIRKQKEDAALNNRAKILKFNDEIMRHVKHSKESFDNILDIIDNYNEYCKEHPEFPNSKCLMACENIHLKYKKCQEQNDFLK